MPRSTFLNGLLKLLLLEKLLRFLGGVRYSSPDPAAPRPRPFAAWRVWWQQRRPLTRRILGNLLIGLGIAAVLWNLHSFNKLRQTEDAGIDWLIRLQWGATLTRPSPPFALIDIDEATYRHWGEPFHIPRDRLLTLIDYAVRGGAALVVVDIDLSQHGFDAAADARLQEYLAHYTGPGQPPLILSRAFRESLDPAVTPYRSERRSFLEEDPRIAQSPLIHWGSPLFNLDDDRVLRRWRLWEIVCTEGRPTVVPSVQLLAVALLKASQQGSGTIQAQLQPALASLAPPSCALVKSNAAAPRPDSTAMIEIAGLKLRTNPDAVAQRILYSQPWRLQPGQARTTTQHQGAETSTLFLRSALPIGDQTTDTTWLAGRVVVIGAGFAETKDIQPTPLGQMPGPLVLVNAIQSLHQYGELTPPPLWIKLLIEALLIVVMSLAFTRFSSFWGLLLSGGLIISLLLPISFVLFRYGVWLDFAIPLLAVQFYQMAVEFREAREQHRTATTPAAVPVNTDQGATERTATTPPPASVTTPTIPTEIEKTLGDPHHESQLTLEFDSANPAADNYDARRNLDQGLAGGSRQLPAGTEWSAHHGSALPDIAKR